MCIYNQIITHPLSFLSSDTYYPWFPHLHCFASLIKALVRADSDTKQVSKSLKACNVKHFHKSINTEALTNVHQIYIEGGN